MDAITDNKDLQQLAHCIVFNLSKSLNQINYAIFDLSIYFKII